MQTISDKKLKNLNPIQFYPGIKKILELQHIFILLKNSTPICSRHFKSSNIYLKNI